MKIRLDALIENFLKSGDRDQATGRGAFPIRVVEVKGDSAIVSVNGRYLEVTTRVPLMPGQVFLVRQSRQEGETELWHLVRKVEESPFPPVTGKCVLSKGPEYGAIVNALSKAGLPVTEENLNRIQHILERTGCFTPSNLLVAITSLKLSIPFDILWHWLGPFAERMVTVVGNRIKFGDGDTPGSDRKQTALEKEDNGAAALGLRIRDGLAVLQKMLRCLNEPPGSFPPEELPVSKEGDSSDIRVLLGGQILTCSRRNAGQEDPFYYIPLFALYRGEEPPVGEILVYPRSSQNRDGGTRIVMVISTRYLGWVRVELTLQESLLKLGMLVEDRNAKTLIESAWPQLEEELRELRCILVWSGCKVGKVRALLREWQEECFNPEVYKAVDLTV